LRLPNKDDPWSVLEARELEKKWISSFIDEYNKI
jgi:hypothetical protein